MGKTLVLFDFDGTITTKDSFLELIQFQKGSFAFYRGMCYVMPFIVLYKAKLIEAQTLKEKVIQYFWKNIDAAEFQQLCESFAQKILPNILRKKAIEQIKLYKQNNADIAVVSASAEDWVKPFCNMYSLTCICTQLEKRDGKITGKLQGKNCKGQEKVDRVKQVFNLSDYENIIVYGDSSGDTHLLKLSTSSFYKPFRK